MFPKTILLNFLIVLISLNSSIATCDDSIFLPKGTRSPFAGYLLPEPTVIELRKQSLERDNFKLINDSLNVSVNLYKSNYEFQNKKIEMLYKQNDELAKSLYSARETSMWERAFYFTLGVAATTLAVYGVKQASK